MIDIDDETTFLNIELSKKQTEVDELTLKLNLETQSGNHIEERIRLLSNIVELGQHILNLKKDLEGEEDLGEKPQTNLSFGI